MKLVEICRGAPISPTDLSRGWTEVHYIVGGHLEEILLFNRFFPTVDICLSREDNSSIKLCDGAQMSLFASFLRPVFAASRVQRISDMHSKFALRPDDVSKYGRHPICDR